MSEVEKYISFQNNYISDLKTQVYKFKTNVNVFLLLNKEIEIKNLIDFDDILELGHKLLKFENELIAKGSILFYFLVKTYQIFLMLNM